jgi:molybdopterin molybdotransferase
MPELFRVLPVEAARARLREHVRPLGAVEQVTLDQALGRVLAADVVSPVDLPAFARSTMDGYAVRSTDTYGATEALPAYLTVIGEVPMGRPPTLRLRPGEAALVHTGGMLPPGADAVVMLEHTHPLDARTIEVTRPVAVGENVIPPGEDVARGQVLLRKGTWLRPQELGVLVGVGITQVMVARRPRVALISTGDEVVPPEVEPAPGQIRDINSTTLAALTLEWGGLPLPRGIVPDDAAALAAAARAALAEADVLVVSAGSSVSTRDMTAAVLGSLGKPGLLVHGVSMHPGKPTILAVADGTPVFGLPGNPVSAMVAFDLFVAPALAWLMGAAERRRPVVRARLAANVPSHPGEEDYVQVRLEGRAGETWAVPVFGKSNLITTMVRADGVLRVPLDSGGLYEGTEVEVALYTHWMRREA